MKCVFYSVFDISFLHQFHDDVLSLLWIIHSRSESISDVEISIFIKRTFISGGEVCRVLCRDSEIITTFPSESCWCSVYYPEPVSLEYRTICGNRSLLV